MPGNLLCDLKSARSCIALTLAGSINPFVLDLFIVIWDHLHPCIVHVTKSARESDVCGCPPDYG